MKRLCLVIAIAVATFCSLQAAQVDETEARQVANKFFSAKAPRFSSQPGQMSPRLAYTAEQGRFYVFDRGVNGGFVVVAGDDRLPQVLGYGDKGDFSSSALPPSVQYWMDEMNREIAYLQSHEDAVAYRPAKRATPVGPLMTTFWDQGSPYNSLCPTYTESNGNTSRAVTGCVATAVAQVMNYHQWPPVGTGSHSYGCNVNDVTYTELSVDFSQSVYRWDLMLDTYDDNSDPESIQAVAKLMLDVGVSMDMGYGSSSGANEVAAMRGLQRYFKYSERSYLLDRDYYSAQDWDQLLVDEITAHRPIIYCGYYFSGNEGGGHAFVFDGFDSNGYFHVNWGWGGYYDGYFVVSMLAPSSGMNFKYMQDAMFGVIPEPQADAVDDFLYIYSEMLPKTISAPLGGEIELSLETFEAQGNALDTAGFELDNGRKNYYALIPLSLGVFDQNGVERQNKRFDYKLFLENRWYSDNRINLNLLNNLDEGEYKIKLSYSMDDGENYDHQVKAVNGKDVYVKMVVRDGMAYLSDCFLSNNYSLNSMVVPQEVTINQPFSVEVTMSYFRPWSNEDGPLGNVYLSMQKDGREVAASELYEVKLESNTEKTYELQMMAPAQWGRYDIVLNDESGNPFLKMDGWLPAEEDESALPIFVLPPCESLVEDFESMTAGSSTNAKNVQGNFTTWSFNKCGVRAPGEDRCNGVNSVMLKKASFFYTAQPLYQDFFLAQATIFNQSTTAAKYTLEYSLDGGTTWEKANTLDNVNAAEAPGNSQTTAIWMLNLSASYPVYFRIAMIGGGSAATYVDDVIFYYKNPADVNYDGEVSIADINVVTDAILSGGYWRDADVNGDGEVNIADINALIDFILKSGR
jgi:hypothetical protein